MSKMYPQAIADFIAANVHGRTARELTEITNARFGTHITESAMKAYKSNHRLKSGMPTGGLKGAASKVFPADIRDFILSNHKGIGPTEMTGILNSTFGTVYSVSQVNGYYSNHKLDSGLSGYFEKGFTPFNKGQKGTCAQGCEKSWFKKGHPPVNHRAVGSQRVDVDGYTLIKTAEPNVWVPLHKTIWEHVKGAIPKGHIITFLDGDKTNITIENLAMITNAEHLELSRSRLRSENPELTQTGILVAKVKTTVRKRQRNVSHPQKRKVYKLKKRMMAELGHEVAEV